MLRAAGDRQSGLRARRKIHSEFVNPYVPDTVCFENLILDELVLFPGMSAKLVDLRSALLRNPFIVCDDPTALLSRAAVKRG